MKILFKPKYPKLTILLMSVILAYYIFSNPAIAEKILKLESLGYLSYIIFGALFTFGFTTPFAVGFFFIANPPNIVIASILAGIGAFLADIIMFNWVKFFFLEEFNKLERGHPVKDLNKLIKRSLPLKIKNYLLYVFIGIIIASPLPDEIGVTLLAGLTETKIKIFAALTFVLHTLGVLAILLI